jgi:hypothetical protein
VTSGRLVSIASWFLAGAICAVSLPHLVHGALDRMIFPESKDEVFRVPSPDKSVDAVMIRTDCGAPCSPNYSVFVVPNGRKIEEKSGRKVFSADDMTNQGLRWSKPHLLEIIYGKALIVSFQNVTSPFLGETDSRNYRVEIRLAPTTPGYSYLTEDGDSE